MDIDTADTVLHTPTGEEGLVAFVSSDKLSYVGWPEGYAELSDCVLVKKASAADRQSLLRQMANMQGDDSRKRYAIHTLAAQQETPTP